MKQSLPWFEKFVLFPEKYASMRSVPKSYNNATMMKFFICFLFIFPVFASSEWVSNKDHSEILFKVPYLAVSEVTGRFNEFNAKTTFDDNQGPEKIEIIIKASSIDTSHKLRDGHLKGSDFFNSTTYPEIKFQSKKIVPVKKGEFTVEGDMTIKGITRPMKISFTLTDQVKDTWGYQNRFVKFNSKLKRKDFNIKWNKTLDEEKYLVGDEVEFWGVFQLQPNDGKTPPSKHMIPDTEYIREREKLLRKKEEEESTFSKKLRKLINGQ